MTSVATTVHMLAALGYDEVTTAMALAALLLVIWAPPPIMVPDGHEAVAVTMAPTAAPPVNPTAVPAF
jgi:hypothetical protein